MIVDHEQNASLDISLSGGPHGFCDESTSHPFLHHLAARYPLSMTLVESVIELQRL